MRSSTGQPKSHGSLLNGTKNHYEYELLHFFVSIKTDFYVMHFSRKIFRMQKKELLFINTLIKGCDSSETVLFWQKVLKVPQTGERQQQVCVCTCVCLCVCVKLLQRCILMATFDFPVTHSALNLKLLYMSIAQSLIIKTSWLWPSG